MKKVLALVAAAGGALVAAGANALPNPVQEGKALYSSEKFRCYQCHGPTGAEGGMGPSFKGVGKKFTRDQLMERAAHNCPPTGVCDPKQLGAIVDYLRSLE